MPKDKTVYNWSLAYAVSEGEVDWWRESYKLNCDCARAIERAIDKHYQNDRLEECAKDLVDEYGFKRMFWVLANTLQQKKDDGRFSEENRKWSKAFYIPEDDVRWHFCVESHPGLTDLFLNQVRHAYQDLGLFNSSHCSEETNYEDKLVIIKGMSLKDEYKTPDNQLFYCTEGNGCRPNALGTKVFGFHLNDMERGYYRRSQIEGVIDEQYIPDWAKSKLTVLFGGEDEGEDEGEGEDPSLEIGGM